MYRSANIKNIRTKPKMYKNILGRKCCARFNGIFLTINATVNSIIGNFK